MKIIGIETSCDDTAVSLIEMTGRRVNIISEIISSQVNIHKKFGGIVPEVAARKHIENFGPILELSLKNIDPKTIDRIAVTQGPGLITSLLIGVETAKTLAYAWNKPIVGVNHLEGHILSNVIEHEDIKFPAIVLVVSGGHTELVLMKRIGQYRVIGQTQDDAAGEAFDKIAKLLNLGYPGGPIIEKLSRKGNAEYYNLPRPMLDHDNFNFSFSGLKTAVLYLHQDGKIPQSRINDLCASFQQAATDVLVAKTIRAAQQYKVSSVLLSGGVAANQYLKQSLADASYRLKNVKFFSPSLKHCTDNATMIAVAGYFNKPVLWSKIKASPNLNLE